MERDYIGFEKSFMPRWHIRYFLSGINFLIGASCLNRSGAGRVWHTGSKLNPVLFMPVSLPELSPVEVYVIHQMHLAEFFFIRQTVWLSRSPLLCNLYTKFERRFPPVVGGDKQCNLRRFHNGQPVRI
jgi:hypothetical protein